VRKMSLAEVNVARRLLASPDRILRLKSPGYWTTSATADGWQTTIQTVRAMERAGWLERTKTELEPRRDPRRLTEAGAAALESMTRGEAS